METNDKWKNGTRVRIWGCEEHTNGLVGNVASWSSVLQPDGSRKEFYGVKMPLTKDGRKFDYDVVNFEKRYLERLTGW